MNSGWSGSYQIVSAILEFQPHLCRHTYLESGVLVGLRGLFLGRLGRSRGELLCRSALGHLRSINFIGRHGDEV
jgi:hypothetical protein